VHVIYTKITKTKTKTLEKVIQNEKGTKKNNNKKETQAYHIHVVCFG